MSTSFRAGVMLSALVGLPAAWVYYGPLPPNAQRVVDRFVAAAKDAIQWDAPAAGPAPPVVAEAPAFLAGPSGGAMGHLGMTPPVESLPIPLPAAPAKPPSASTAPLEPLLAQLRQLGAAAYALERWGAAGNLYRFRCEMPVTASAVMTQQFEAIAADPQASVAQVLAEVSSWHLARADRGLLR